MWTEFGLNNLVLSLCSNHGFVSYFLSGIKQLQQWTKESLSEKPFCTVKCLIWTETPVGAPFKDIFTKLKWVSRHSRTFGLVHEDLADVTKLLSENHLGYRGPVRILVAGKYFATVHFNRSKYLRSFMFTFQTLFNQ